ncbi:MAG: flippase [Armatimonadota bacterium]
MGDTARSVLRNSFASTAGQFINLAVGIISNVYVARSLGVSQFGMFNWGLGMATLVGPLANASIDNVIVRNVARNKRELPELFASAMFIKALASTICYFGIILYIYLRGYTGLQLFVGYILCAIVITESLGYACRSSLVALEQQTITATISVIVNTLRVALVVTFVRYGFNILAVSIISFGASAATFIAQTAAIKKYSHPSDSWVPRMRSIKCLLVGGMSYMASTVFAGVFDRIDFVLLEIYCGVNEVGIYSAAYRILEIMTMIALNFGCAIFPILSRQVKDSRSAHATTLLRATKYLLIFGIPFSTSICLLSHDLMVGLYSSRFSAAGTCLAMLACSRILLFAIIPGQQSVQARNAQIWLAPPAIIRTIVNLGINLLLIPRYGFLGASIAMLISEPIYHILIYLFAFRGIERFNPLALMIRPVLASIFMAGEILLLRPYSAIFSAIIAIPTYLLAFYFLGGIDVYDKQLIIKLISNIKPSKKNRCES